MIRRGEIYWVRLDPAQGSESKKTRPALVISNDQNNEFANTVTVLPVSSQVDKIYPFEVQIDKGMGGVPETSKILANHIRTLDKSRLLGSPLGPALDHEEMAQVEQAVKLHLDIP